MNFNFSNFILRC